MRAYKPYPEALFEIEDGQIIVTTNAGRRVRCLPVAEELMIVGEGSENKPLPPTYVVTDVSGGQVERYHNETTIKDPLTSQEERDAWEEYSAESEIWLAEKQKLQARFLAEEGIVCLDIPERDELIKWGDKRRERYRMPIPPEYDDLVTYYIATQIIRGNSDAEKIIAGIFAASGYDQEVLAATVARFQPVVDGEKEEEKSRRD
jgi:hypothetical protein